MVIGYTNFDKIVAISLPSLTPLASLGEVLAKCVKFFLRARITLTDSCSYILIFVGSRRPWGKISDINYQFVYPSHSAPPPCHHFTCLCLSLG